MKVSFSVPALPVSNCALRLIADVHERATLIELDELAADRRLVSMNRTLARQVRPSAEEQQ